MRASSLRGLFFAAALLAACPPVHGQSAPGGSLLARARKVADVHTWSLFGYETGFGVHDNYSAYYEMDGTYEWLDSERVLFMRGVTPSYQVGVGGMDVHPGRAPGPWPPVALAILNVKTGKESPLEGLSRRFNEVDGGSGWLHVSPDERWVLWPAGRAISSGAYVVAFDGSRATNLDGEPVAEVDWLADSRRYVTLWGYPDHVTGFHVGSVAGSEGVPKDAPEPWFVAKILCGVGMLRDGRVIGIVRPKDTWWPNQAKVQIICTPVLENPAKQRLDEMTLPFNWTLDQALPASAGGHIAWLLWEKDEKAKTRRLYLCVSDERGRGLRNLGSVTVPSEGGGPLHLHRLRWTPDGRTLSFVYDGWLYAIDAGQPPATGRKPASAPGRR